MEISESSTTSILAVNNSQENNGDDTDNDVEEIVSSKRGNAKVYDDYATYTNSILKTAIQLLEAKWRAINDVNLNQFFEYFNEQWMGQYTIGWYESYAEGYPSTNNALESTNKTIKDDGTNRDRLSLNDFMTCMGNLLYEWSHDRDFSFQTTRKFELKPIIETKEWTFGYSWLKLKKRLVKFTHDNILFYMCTSSNCTFDITKTRCKEYWSQNDGWYDFEEFIKWSNEVKAIKIDIDDWQLSTCSCEYWKKHLKCKHVIGISFILKLNEFPGLDLAIEGNAKRGRKKKANPSLERNSIAPINNQFINQSSATNLIDNENLQRPVLSSISIQNEQINENHSIFVSNGIASSNNDQVIVTQAPVESTSNNFRAPEKRGRGRPKKNKENDANLITENQTNDENSNQSARLSKRRKP